MFNLYVLSLTRHQHLKYLTDLVNNYNHRILTHMILNTESHIQIFSATVTHNNYLRPIKTLQHG